MERDAQGNVVGDKYRLTPDGLRQLSGWLDQDFDGTLGRSGARVTVVALLNGLVEGRRPLNGFGIVATSRVLAAVSDATSTPRSERGTKLKFRLTGMS